MIYIKIIFYFFIFIYQGINMNDEELARFLMTHAASGLTEDPNVHKEAKQNL